MQFLSGHPLLFHWLSRKSVGKMLSNHSDDERAQCEIRCSFANGNTTERKGGHTCATSPLCHSYPKFDLWSPSPIESPTSLLLSSILFTALQSCQCNPTGGQGKAMDETRPQCLYYLLCPSPLCSCLMLYVDGATHTS